MVGKVGFVGKMGRRLRLMYEAWRVWWPWWLDIAIVVIAIACITGCRTREMAEVDNHSVVQIRRDTVCLWHRDSIRVLDSVAVYVHNGGDTVYVTTTRWRYRDRVLTDTIYKMRSDTLWRTDSVSVSVPVERQASRWEQRLMTVAKSATLIGGGVVLFGIGYRFFRRKM